MTKKRTRLTVGERILLLLMNYTRFRDEMQVPVDVTQDGIANNLGIIRSAVPRAVGSLIDRGLVEEELAHVKGLARRRKVYHLTDEGIMRARELFERISGTTVSVVESGERSRKTIGELFESGDVSLKTVSDVIVRGSLDMDTGSSMEDERGTEKVSYTHSLSPPEIFLGREREIEEISSAITSRKRRMTVVYGIAGVGKTTLSWKITQIFSRNMNIFYLDLKEWTTLSYVLKELGTFLSNAGWKDLSSYLETTVDLDIELVTDILKNIPGEFPLLLILDDLHRAPDQIVMFLSSLKERLPAMKGVNVIILSRERVPFYDIRDVKIYQTIGEMELMGFDRVTSMKLLKERGFSDEESKMIVQMTGGHPLALVLVEKDAYNYDIGDFMEFLKGEIFDKLDREAVRFLGLLSLSRLQLTPEELGSIMSFGKELVNRLQDMHLVFSTPGGFVIHDLIRDMSDSVLTAEEKLECHSRLADLFHTKLEDLGFHQEVPGTFPPFPFAVDDEKGLGPVPLYVSEEVYHLIGAGRGKEAVRVLMEALMQIPSKDLVKEHYSAVERAMQGISSGPESFQVRLLGAVSDILEGKEDHTLKTLKEISRMDAKDEEQSLVVNCARIWIHHIEERVNGPENAMNALDSLRKEGVPEGLDYYMQVKKASLLYKMGDHKGASKQYRTFLDSIINNDEFPDRLRSSVREAVEKAEKGSIQEATDQFQKIMELTVANRELLREELPFVDVDHHLLSAIYSLYHGRK
ncbi:MAG: hypothetical protein DRN37_08765 [Thermoplasmata archaeon]|nr:MAG: hypothetical protein DRN37_08765 [Thermoplasmata archaeon]HHD15871.1 hypothetical protein [Euryarchaeota archaeon]